MIYDSMENLKRYMHLHPRLDEMLRYLHREKSRKLPDRRNELDGNFYLPMWTGISASWRSRWRPIMPSATLPSGDPNAPILS